MIPVADSIPYCGAAPVPGEIWARWNTDFWLLLCIGIALAGAFRLEKGRRQAILSMLAVWAFLYISPFCALGSALFWVRAIHHLALMFLAAPLLARAMGPLPHRGSPMFWTIAQALILWAWHWPMAYDWALSFAPAYWAMQLSILLSATAFWRALERSALPVRLLALVATMMQMSLLGAVIAFARTALYAPHWFTTQPWGLSPLADQQLAGLIMWIPGGTVYLAVALLCAWRLLDARPYPGLGERV